VKKFVSALVVFLSIFLCAGSALAGNADLEKDLASSLRRSLKVIEKVERKLSQGLPVNAEVTQLQREAEGVRASNLLLEERFRVRGNKARELGGKARQRQEDLETRYREIFGQLQPLLDELAWGGPVSAATLKSLRELFRQIVPEKTPPIYGSLPYSHLNYPAREPAAAPLVVPAYRGGSGAVTAADTRGTADAPITPEIVELAKSLDWNPVRIYEWVQENIETEWYWGSMKGAQETLRQRSGNDADQAALLIAMLRSAGFPARYVRGVVEFFPGMAKAQSLTGLDDPLKIAAFFQKAGIPFEPIITGGRIANFRIEHIWVETEVPYANYRGALLDNMGKTWIALDTHLKPPGYQWNAPEDFSADFNLAALRDDYLSQSRTETPLEYLRSAFDQYLGGNFDSTTFQDHLRTRTLVAEPLGILPASLQFRPTAITGEYTALPVDLRHRVTFTAATTDGNELFTVIFDAASLSNRPVSLSYEPETVEDQQIIHAYGGLDNTPSYLVRLRPVLKVDGERMVVGRDGLPMGADYTLTIELTSSNGQHEVISHHIIGNISSLGIVSQQVAPPAELPLEGKDAERLQYESALSYIERWNVAEEEMAAFLKVAIARPLPTVVTVGGAIDVDYLFDIPQGFDWKGVFIDAGFRRIETVASPGQEERVREFMRLSALEGSILENRIFEDTFDVASISTAKLLASAPQSLVSLLTLDSSNVDALLPTLELSENIKGDIRNAAHQGFSITLPEAELGYENWTGIGYIKENPATGEAGYMLSGMIAGGMTAEEWADQALRALFENAYSEPPNQDPGAAARIFMIPVSDRQNGTVGQNVEESLAVLVVDLEGRPVAGAEVTFTALAGGALFDGSKTVRVSTGSNGIAKSRPTLGTTTKDNPSYQRANQGDAYVTQVGVNLFNASVSGQYGNLSLPKPFEIYGQPDVPVSIVKLLGDGNFAMANNPAGTLSVLVVDQYQNPVSNVPVTYQTENATSMASETGLPQGYRSITFYDRDGCTAEYPLYGECATSPSITMLTAHFGVGVNAILGNTVNTKYEVSAKTPGVPGEIFTLRSGGYWEIGEYLAPELFIRHLTRVNDRGETVNAAKAGEQLKAPLVATMVLMTSDYTMAGPTTCTAYDSRGQSYQTDCWTIKGSGLVKTERIIDGTVPFTPVSGGGAVGSTENRGDGDYQTTYTTGLIPSLNQIEAIGEATVTVPQVYASLYGFPIKGGYTTETLPLRTLTLKSGQQALFNRTTKELLSQTPQKISYEVYGVNVTTEVSPKVLYLGEGNMARDDLTVTYSILPDGNPPTGYDALSAEVDLSSVTFSGGAQWKGYLIGSAVKGTGTAVFSFGTEFDPQENHYVQPVLNRGGDIEIRGDKVPLSLVSLDQAFQVERIHLVNEFDSPIPGPIGSPYTDTYQTLSFVLPEPGSVNVTILDENMQARGTLVPETALAAGTYNFLLDYEQVRSAGFKYYDSPTYYVQLERRLEGRTAAHKILYLGKMNENTSTAKMLGQTMVHDVLIQDGSLNLSRQDLALAGRGPQLAFSRSYNNQNSPRGFKPLGRGWSHSLDMSLQVLSTDPNTSEPVPAWVSGLKGRFFTSDDLPQQPKLPTMVQVNGAIFKKKNGIWYAERSKHGKLEEIAGGWVFTAKDGTRYRYDRPHGQDILVGTITDRNGNTQSFNYDQFGQLEKVTDAVGRELKFRYQKFPGIIDDHNTRLVSVTGPDAIELTFAYNEHGYLQSAARANRIENYEYARETSTSQREFNLVKATDGNQHSYSYEYFGPGEVHSNLANFTRVLKSQDIIKRVVYPDGNAAAFQYDVATANKRIVTDLRGNATTYTLNYIGNPTKIEEPLGKITQMTWSMDEGKPDNVMTSRTDARGYKTSYEYDALGNVTRETDPDNHSIVTVWNQPFSLPEQRTDRNSVVQRWNYDQFSGNLNYQVDGDGKRTEYTYYPTGEVQNVKDPRLNVTSYTYDANGNPDTVTGQEGSVTDFDYDVRGRKEAETDPNGNRTTYQYDALDYPAAVTYPALTAYALPAGSGNVKPTIYDALGNLLSETDRTGLTLTYTYTPRNQVESITRSVGGQKTFGYDENGNLTSETDWKGIATTQTYDELNRRVTTVNRLGDSMGMGYDLAGNLTQTTDFEGRVTTFAYDKLNRQTDIWQPAPGGHIVSTYYFEANPKTNLKTVTDAEGHTTAFEYNGRYLRTKRTNALAGIYAWGYDNAGNLASETDEEGRVTSYVYDRQSRRTEMHRPEASNILYQYDAAGNVRFVTDPRSNPTETRYDQWNRPWQVIDADSYVTATERDGEGREVKVIDGNGHVRNWLRDPRGLALTATDAEGHDTAFTYDPNGNVETVSDARGFITRTTYDAEDRKLLTTEAEGTPEARTTGVLLYDKIGNPLQVRDGNGHVTVTAYNALNLPATITDPLGGVVESTYDKNGKPLTVKNRRGHTTTTIYDALGRVDTVTDPLQQTVVTTYDKVGNIKTVTDKRDIVTENIYDDLNRLTEQSRSSVRLVTNEYDGNGNQTAVVDAENHRTEQAYNKRNLLATSTFADGTSQSRIYDGIGNLLTLTDEENKVTAYTHDNENRQRTLTFAGETNENVYDEVGNLVQVIKPKGNGRSMTYDGLKRLATVIEGGLTTAYTYDGNSNLLSQTDPLGHEVEYTYDALNRKAQHIQRKSSGDLTVSYDLYDAEGNLKQLTDAKGQVFTYTYDALNRQTVANYPNVATAYLTLQKVETGYDANNNITTVTETKQQSGGGTVTDSTVNIYDNFDRLDSGTQRDVLIDFGYDLNGNRTSVSTANGSTSYTFNTRNRLETAVVGSETTSYSYTPAGRQATVTYPNGTSASYSYWPSNRIETIVHKAGETVISSYAYTYDSNGNRARQVEAQGAASETTDYAYDDLDRLERYTIHAGADTTVTAYTFDGYNRKTEILTENGVATADKTYSYDETDWLTQVADSAPATPVTITYSYDNNGNTIQKSDSSKPGEDVLFTYDSANRMVQTKQGLTLLGRYDYNAQGLRIRHRSSERGDVDYYYDDGAVLEERTAAGGLLAHYRYADRLLSLDTGSEVQYYHHDALGSTVDLTDPTGSVKVRYTLDPWGQIRNQIGDSVNRMIFTGQEHDEQTGLIYFGARYYDPDTARFLTQDSYLGEPGTPPSLHRYLYAYSNPTAYYDPNGHWVVTKTIADTFHGWAGSVRKSTGDLNNGMAQNNGWEKAGMLALAAAGGVGSTLIDAAGGIADLADLGADVGLATDPLMSRTQWGQDARQRMSGIGAKAAVVGKGVAAMAKSSAEMWIEDPKGTLEQTRIGLGILGQEVAGGLKDYGSKLANGDLNAVASASGIVFDVAATVATLGSSQVTKAGKVGRAGELAEEIVESAARYGDDAARLAEGGVCFGAGTLVLAAEGLRPIEEVMVGDLVASRDQATGQTSLRPVVRTFLTPDQPVLKLVLHSDNGADEKLVVTAEHPFWVKASGWVAASKLLPGNEVFTSSGGWVKVGGATWLARKQTVYNLEVDGYHTYFVGESGAWVHNICKAPIPNKVSGTAREQRLGAKLEAKFGEDNILRERYLRDAQGNSVRDSEGSRRRIDFVIRGSEGKGTAVEATSKTASKTIQAAKEEQIRDAGGIFVRDPKTRELIEVEDISRLIRMR
jgi:RHS repeat-associated protein